MIVLIDTCVILDALQKREPFWEDAAKIFLAAANEKYQGIITAKALTEGWGLCFGGYGTLIAGTTSSLADRGNEKPN